MSVCVKQRRLVQQECFNHRTTTDTSGLKHQSELDDYNKALQKCINSIYGIKDKN